MEVIILVGGKGTRLQTVVSDVPKPLASISGKPFLHFLLKELEKQSVHRVILASGYGKEKIQNFTDQSNFNFEIIHSEETEPLGTGGSLRQALTKTQAESVLALNGDTFFPVSLSDLLSFQEKGHFDVTLALKKVDESSRYGSVVLQDGKVVGFLEKTNSSGPSLINGGVMAVNKKTFLARTNAGPFSLEKDYFPQIKNLGGKEFSAPFIDIGIPEDYFKAQTLIPQWSAD